MSNSENQPYFHIQRVYLKELSLEQPNSPAVFLNTETPSIEVEASVNTQSLANDLFENTVTVTITAKIKEKEAEKVAFLIEATQAGIFEIRHVAAEQLSAILGTTCPAIVFPYLRANIADLMIRASFPPLHLSEINFQALYEQQHARQSAQPNGASQPSAQPSSAQEN
jgi:preprotein translocase subunit SecB